MGAMEFIEDLKATKAKVELGNKALRLLPENFSMSDMMYDPSGDPELTVSRNSTDEQEPMALTTSSAATSARRMLTCSMLI